MCMIAVLYCIRRIEVLEKMDFLHMYNVQDDKCCLWDGGLLLWIYIQYAHARKLLLNENSEVFMET